MRSFQIIILFVSVAQYLAHGTYQYGYNAPSGSVYDLYNRYPILTRYPGYSQSGLGPVVDDAVEDIYDENQYVPTDIRHLLARAESQLPGLARKFGVSVPELRFIVQKAILSYYQMAGEYFAGSYIKTPMYTTPKIHTSGGYHVPVNQDVLNIVRNSHGNRRAKDVSSYLSNLWSRGKSFLQDQTGELSNKAQDVSDYVSDLWNQGNSIVRDKVQEIKSEYQDPSNYITEYLLNGPSVNENEDPVHHDDKRTSFKRSTLPGSAGRIWF